MKSKETNKSSLSNTKAELGRKYFDVVDLYTNKIITRLIEESSALEIKKETLVKISNLLNDEKAKAKNWGYDQISKAIK